jgi:2-succinyl-5-enolpyruvyl-6-hydroxy-3-cyclohexene-1-carboxylate synthase
MSVAIPSRQATFCATFVDELVASGVTDAVLCPGSRSTPLALAIASSELRLHVRLDERSAGFFAQGLARITKRPVLVVVTSGTAAAELLASVVEASLDRVPLVIATADRPPELQEIGAPQTIRQRDLFGTHVRLALDPGPVHALDEREWRPLVSRAVLEASGVRGQPGPVHLNLAFVEPLLGEVGPLPPRRAGGRGWYEVDEPVHSVEPAGSTSARRTVVVAGAGIGRPSVLLDAARQLNWPVIADPRSGCRRSDEVVIAAADSFLREPAVREALRAERLILAGAPPASKVLGELIADAAVSGVEILVLGVDGPARHPQRTAATFVLGEPAGLVAAMASNEAPAAASWLDGWRRADAAAQGALEQALETPALSEPAVARLLSRSLSGSEVLVCSSSMPIRDLEWFGAITDDPALVIANRGANGIDGVVSTAMGVAAGHAGATVCLIGDLAFLHDVSALVDQGKDEVSLTIVVLDNGGGGIFSFLPQHGAVGHERFEQLFGTPPRVSIESVARGFGIVVRTVATRLELSDVLAQSRTTSGVTVVIAEIPDREANVELHDALHAAVGAAASKALG